MAWWRRQTGIPFVQKQPWCSSSWKWSQSFQHFLWNLSNYKRWKELKHQVSHFWMVKMEQSNWSGVTQGLSLFLCLLQWGHAIVGKQLVLSGVLMKPGTQLWRPRFPKSLEYPLKRRELCRSHTHLWAVLPGMWVSFLSAEGLKGFVSSPSLTFSFGTHYFCS